MPILPIAWKRYLTCCGLLLPVNYWWYLALPVSEIYKNVLLWGKLPLRSQIFSLLLMRTRAKKIAGRYYELLPGVPSQPGKARGAIFSASRIERRQLRRHLLMRGQEIRSCWQEKVTSKVFL